MKFSLVVLSLPMLAHGFGNLKQFANVVPESGWCIGTGAINSCDWDHHDGSRSSVQSCWEWCEAKFGADLGAVNFIHDISCCCVDECYECSGGPVYTVAVRNDRWVPETCGNWRSEEQIDCTPGGPDLVVDEEELRASVTDEWMVGEDGCWIIEGCLGGQGDRRILRFSTRISNQGCEDFYIGEAPWDPEESPADHPGFVYNECHGHYHYENYAY